MYIIFTRSIWFVFVRHSLKCLKQPGGDSAKRPVVGQNANRWDGAGRRKHKLTNRCGTKTTAANLFLTATWDKEPEILQKYS